MALWKRHTLLSTRSVHVQTDSTVKKPMGLKITQNPTRSQWSLLLGKNSLKLYKMLTFTHWRSLPVMAKLKSETLNPALLCKVSKKFLRGMYKPSTDSIQFPSSEHLNGFGSVLFCLIMTLSLNLFMTVLMYVCIRGGPYRPLHCDPQWSIVLPLSLIIPSAIPHFRCSAGFYTWGCRSSHLVPWDVDPGGEILDKLGPHIHTGYVWLFCFLPDTCHKLDCYLLPVWRGVHSGDSVL
jgi:hypothetical protein